MRGDVGVVGAWLQNAVKCLALRDAVTPAPKLEIVLKTMQPAEAVAAAVAVAMATSTETASNGP